MIAICSGVADSRRAVAAGMMSSDVIRSTPTSFMAMAMTTASSSMKISRVASGRMPSASASSALTVPGSALFRRDDGWAVFVVEGDRARLRPVRLGGRSGLLAEVLEGVEAGDAVIVHPDDAVDDGVRVRLFQE